jgi:hypothetical protein
MRWSRQEGPIKVLLKFRRLGAENEDQFRPNKGVKCVTGNEILHNEITGIQTSFFHQFWG